MARHYISTNNSSSLSSWTLRDSYGSYWFECSVGLWMDADNTCTWEVTAKNDTGGKCVCSLVLYINGTKLWDHYYDGSEDASKGSSSTNPQWTADAGFPFKHNTKCRGSLTVTGSSFTVDLIVCRSQAAVTYSNSGRLTNTDVVARWGDAKNGWGKKYNRQYYEDPGAGTISVVNNKDNTFTVSSKTAATAGDTHSGAGTNTIRSTTYKYSFTSGFDFDTAGTVISPNTKIAVSGTNVSSKTVYVKRKVTGTKGGSATTSEESVTVHIYRNPLGVTDVAGTWHNNRCTLKKPGTLSWTTRNPAMPSYSTNSLVGFYFYLLRKPKDSSDWEYADIWSVSEPGTKRSSTWNTSSWGAHPNPPLGSSVSTIKYYAVRSATKTDIQFDLGYNNQFAVGDQVKLVVQPYAEDGNTTDMFGAYSAVGPYTVQNAGVVNIRTSNGWKEGQVYIKTTDGWREADCVYTKTASGWKESE